MKLLDKISRYSSLIKISHAVFSLPFAIMGFFLGLTAAHEKLNVLTILYVLLCVFFARNAAMSFNRIIDRKYDSQNQRTAVREIPSGKISVRNALIFLITNILLFVGTTFLINTLCFYLSPVALLAILGYSYTKRFTYLCHYVLGIGLGLAPIGAYLAVTSHFDVLPLIYSFAVMGWVAGFDIVYALGDFDFDKKMKLRSIPARFGIKKAMALSVITHILSFGLFVLAACLQQGHLWLWLGVLAFGGFLIYQHLIVKSNDLSRLNLAFFTLNGISGLVYLAFFLLDNYVSV
jgi:4-hydroxybenzoate polyprenyltransferase